MSAIMVEENVFILEDLFGKKHELLNCKKLLSNKSSIPMYSFAETRTIPQFLLQLLQKHKENFEEKSAGGYFLFDILITSFLIRQSAPFHVLELGGDNGILSYHLASLLGGFHKESFLCSVCHTIGNNSNNKWLDAISQVDDPPELSFLVTDYENTALLGQNFDIVVINGTINFPNPYLVLKEAERLVKENGTLLAFLQNTPLLEDSFKLEFPDRKEYIFVPGVGVLVKEDWTTPKEEKTKQSDSYTNIIKEAEQMITKKESPEQLRKVMQKIEIELDRAISEYKIKQKLELIQLKETVLETIVRAGNSKSLDRK